VLVASAGITSVKTTARVASLDQQRGTRYIGSS
jgi:hypothetical protein